MLGDAGAAAGALLAVRGNKPVIARNRIGERFDAVVFRRYGLNNKRLPTVGPFRYRQQLFQLALCPEYPIAVGLIDGEHVANLHDSSFNGLNIIAHSGHQDDDCDICRLDDVNLILPDADRFNDDFIIPCGIQYRYCINGGARQSAEIAARRHAANEDAGVGCHPLHAYAVAENGAARKRARRVYGKDADALAAGAISGGQPVNQRALAGAWRSGNADDQRMAGVREERFQQRRRFSVTVFDRADGARDGPLVAAKNFFNQCHAHRVTGDE